MNCPFCATGQAGLTRNMSAAEIIEQIVRANALIAAGGLGGKKRDDHSLDRVSKSCSWAWASRSPTTRASCRRCA